MPTAVAALLSQATGGIQKVDIDMNIAVLTNEYPPNAYGGAGVHVEYLTREVARLADGQHHVRVLCFGDQDEQAATISVTGVQPPVEILSQDPRHERLFSTLLQGLVMGGALADIDLVHCHTWYTHFAGCLGKYLHGVPLVLTTHSLEPHRPWKVEQLGTAYHASTWVERTAYHNADGVIAVSESMKHDVQSLYGVPPERILVTSKPAARIWRSSVSANRHFSSKCTVAGIRARSVRHTRSACHGASVMKC